MKEVNVKVKTCAFGNCFMTGEKADVSVAIRIEGGMTNKSLTNLIDILTALQPPVKEPVQERSMPVANPDGDDDIPF